MSTNELLLYPFVLGNDGTALKPAIQFDERQKVNVGLVENVDLEFVRKNQFLKKEKLQSDLVCEALVTSITCLDNSSSLPIAVMYVQKKGKTGDEMKQLFTNQIKILQMCERCVK